MLLLRADGRTLMFLCRSSLLGAIKAASFRINLFALLPILDGHAQQNFLTPEHDIKVDRLSYDSTVLCEHCG
jgi:hypothetical protein